MTAHRMRLRSPVLAALALGALVATDSVAAPNSSDRAAAELLFDQARKLTAAGKHAEACPKYAESQRLDPGVGTLLYLADCFEETGKTGSAWISFREAAALAAEAKQTTREKTASARAAALEPKLIRLTIEVPKQSQLPNLEVQRDGSVVGSAGWSLAIPVDPGSHVISATAPGHVPFRMTIEAKDPGRTLVVTVPKLDAEPVVAPPASASAAPAASASAAPALAASQKSTGGSVDTSSGGTTRTIGLVGMGIGGAAVLAGAYFGLSASSKWSDAKSHCVGGVCSAEANRLSRDAKSAGNLSTAFMLVGAVVGGAGAYLYWTAPKGSQVGVAPVPGGAVVGWSGSL